MKRINSTIALHLQQTLMLGAHTIESLAAICGLSIRATRRWVNSMREAKAVYIADWTEDTRGRLFVAQYRWGKKADKARPGPQRTSTDRMRDHRARKAATC